MSNAISGAPRPAHVPDALIYDFDVFRDPDLLSDPHAKVAEIVRSAPSVFWTPRNGGHWVIAGYREVYDASRDTQTFSSNLQPDREYLRSLMPPGFGHVPQAIPINLDPPLHTIYRTPLQARFSPKAMAARREDIRKLADSLIDSVIGRGECDFIAEVAEPLPVKVFLQMMGLPLERLAEFRELVHEFLAPAESVIEQTLRMRKVADAIKGEIESRRTHPQDDILSLLWSLEIDGKPMSFELMEDFGVLLFVAGLDTVINGIGYGVRHLAMNPELQGTLRQEPGLIGAAVEELLRRYTFTIPLRLVATDTQFAGCVMKTGEFVYLFLPGADLDPREFERPEGFDLNRSGRPHVAFGIGPHRCLGSHLARMELQVVIEQVLARFPDFRLDADKPVKFHGGNILAMDSLPLRWN